MLPSFIITKVTTKGQNLALKDLLLVSCLTLPLSLLSINNGLVYVTEYGNHRVSGIFEGKIPPL